MADMVAAEFAGDAVIEHSPDPRVEKEEHYYRAAHTKLLDLGLVPHLLTSSVIQSILAVADKYKGNVDADGHPAHRRVAEHRQRPGHLRRDASRASHGRPGRHPVVASSSVAPPRSARTVRRLMRPGRLDADPPGRAARPAGRRPMTSTIVVGMPRARRRRRRSAAERGRGRTCSSLAAAGRLAAVVLVGRLAGRDPRPVRGLPDLDRPGYGALATRRRRRRPTRPGRQLAALMDSGPAAAPTAALPAHGPGRSSSRASTRR